MSKKLLFIYCCAFFCISCTTTKTVTKPLLNNGEGLWWIMNVIGKTTQNKPIHFCTLLGVDKADNKLYSNYISALTIDDTYFTGLHMVEDSNILLTNIFPKATASYNYHNKVHTFKIELNKTSSSNVQVEVIIKSEKENLTAYSMNTYPSIYSKQPISTNVYFTGNLVNTFTATFFAHTIKEKDYFLIEAKKAKIYWLDAVLNDNKKLSILYKVENNKLSIISVIGWDSLTNIVKHRYDKITIEQMPNKESFRLLIPEEFIDVVVAPIIPNQKIKGNKKIIMGGVTITDSNATSTKGQGNLIIFGN